MNPWVALPGACRLSSVTLARQPSMSPLAIHSTALASNSGSGPCGAELARAAELERQVAGADHRHAQVRRPGVDQLADGPAELDEALGPRQRRREDVGVDRHDRQVVLRAHGDDRAGDRVVDAQLVGEREVEVAVDALAQHVGRQLLVPAQQQPRQAELAFLVVVVGVVERRLADEELRHVVQPQLVEVVRADHHQHVRAGPRQRLAVRLDLAHPLGRERRRLVGRQPARPVEERVVGRGQDRHQLRPCSPLLQLAYGQRCATACVQSVRHGGLGATMLRTRRLGVKPRVRRRAAGGVMAGRGSSARTSSRRSPAGWTCCSCFDADRRAMTPGRGRRRGRPGPPHRAPAAAHAGRSSATSAATGGAFALTPKVLRLGMAYVSSLGLWDIARPHLAASSRAPDESSSMAQLDGSDIVYVARVAVPKIIALRVDIGTRFPALQTSQGKVLLAALEPDAAARRRWPSRSRAGPAAVPAPRRAEDDRGRAAHGAGPRLGAGRRGARSRRPLGRRPGARRRRARCAPP